MILYELSIQFSFGYNCPCVNVIYLKHSLILTGGRSLSEYSIFKSEAYLHLGWIHASVAFFYRFGSGALPGLMLDLGLLNLGGGGVPISNPLEGL